jgi:hypothetical protein
MNIVHFVAARCGCREEFYRHLPPDISLAYTLWHDPVEFVRLLTALGFDEDTLRRMAQSLLLPFPRATSAPGFSDNASPIDAWQLARNWIWDHALMEVLRIHYPLQDIAPKLMEMLA